MDAGPENDHSDEEPPSKLIDGNAIAAQIREEVTDGVVALAKLSSSLGGDPIVPALAVILVGDRPDSATYVRMKKKACAQVGILDLSPPPLPASASEAAVLAEVAALNADPRVHGILVQLPLPPHIDEQAVLEAVLPRKDVDGLHPANLAKLATTQTHAHPNAPSSVAPQRLPGIGTRPGTVGRDGRVIHAPSPTAGPASSSEEEEEEDEAAGGEAADEEQAKPPASAMAALAPVWDSGGFSVACTPLGVVELLDRSGIALQGATVAVVGRSNMVGVPLALLLMQRDATVTIVHSKTKDPQMVCRACQVVVVACGRAELVDASWIGEGAVVVDVGIHAVPAGPNKKAGKKKKLVGDVNFASVEPRCGLITPVPGGVGPMTIAMLLRNTLQAAERAAYARADRVRPPSPPPAAAAAPPPGAAASQPKAKAKAKARIHPEEGAPEDASSDVRPVREDAGQPAV